MNKTTEQLCMDLVDTVQKMTRKAGDMFINTNSKFYTLATLVYDDLVTPQENARAGVEKLLYAAVVELENESRERVHS